MKPDQRVSPCDGRKLVGTIVDIFPTVPPHLPMVSVVWDGDKSQERRWFPVRDLKVLVEPVPDVTGATIPQTSLRTWHKESLVVGIILAAVAVIKGQPIEWLGALAVFLTFMHAQIAFRLSESESRQSLVQVECYWKAQYYFLAKEACWFLYFICLGAWSALIGVLIFLLYPLWRKNHLGQKQWT
jgi:hypothetical protein